MLKSVGVWVCIAVALLAKLQNIDTSKIKNTDEDLFRKSPFVRVRNSDNYEVLDDIGRAVLGWTVESQTITFELEVETHGYVGFGISPSGSMAGADIFIAGVFGNGTNYYGDYYAKGFSQPKLDTHSDWTLHEAREFTEESFSGTILKFSRLINTCDHEDYPIGLDTTRLIWALGTSDTVEYHTPHRRGSKSVNLLGAKMPEVDLEPLSNWTMTLDMEMLENDTVYWCSLHKGPKFAKKHHIVAFDAFLPDSNALTHTHHFVIYNCHNTIDDLPLEHHLRNYTVENGFLGDHCFRPYDPDKMEPIPRAKLFCKDYLYVWAKGGKKMVFPENVGYPIGHGEQAGRESFFMMEIHYDNPEEKVGVQFETGVTFYYTDEIRSQDAGQLIIGHDTNPSITIPPNSRNFVTAGHCGSFCSSEKFPKDGIKVFNSLLHSHLSGRKLKLRHFRGSEELPWLDFDDHYDFNYQQNKQLNQELTVMPGDHLTLECTYDSMWKNGKVVIGDLATTDEMCQSYIWYYPKIDDLDICGSSYDLHQGFIDLGITNYTILTTIGTPKIRINQPIYLEGDYEESLSTKYEWTEKSKQELDNKRRASPHNGVCYGQKHNSLNPKFQVAYPKTREAYHPVGVCETDSTKDSGSGLQVSVALILTLITLLYFIVQ